MDFISFFSHSFSGITYRLLCSNIRTKYAIEITRNREALIKKQIIELRNSNDLVNITGRGLTGHFKVNDKKKFRAKIKKMQQEKRIKKRQRRGGRTEEHHSTQESPVRPVIMSAAITAASFEAEPDLEQYGIIPSQQYDSMFGTTPQDTTGVHTSTPIIPENVLSLAPMRKRKLHEMVVLQNQNVADEDTVQNTPRSSLPSSVKRIRRLIN